MIKRQPGGRSLMRRTAQREVTTRVPSANWTMIEFILPPRTRMRQGCPKRSGSLVFQRQMCVGSVEGIHQGAGGGQDWRGRGAGLREVGQ